MKKIILLFLGLVPFISYSQQRILTKKIVTTVRFTENKVQSSALKDSVSYNYIVNKRFFWEATDKLFSELKAKRCYLTAMNGDTIQWDTMISDLTKKLNTLDFKKYSKKDIEKVLENEIRAVKFMEEWFYDDNTMQISKSVIAYCPIIQRDSVSLIDEDLKAKTYFEYEIGWIRQKSSSSAAKSESDSEDTLLITRNIQYTMPIYNPQPYHWWDNNLEAEYSIPFFETLIAKADTRQILCYENPDALEPFSLPELEKRKKHSVTTTIYTVDENGTESETDTIINLVYTGYDIDRLRFGEELFFNKKDLTFTKKVNYYAPVIRIFTSNGAFIGFYPLYYIREQ